MEECLLEDEGKEKANIFEAAEKNDLEKLKVFFDEAFVWSKIANDDKQTVAHVAAKHGYFEMLQYMAEKTPSILEEKDRKNQTPFSLALEKGSLDIVKYIMEEHPTCTLMPDFLIMQTTVQFGHLPILKYLLDERNFDVNMVNKLNESPLFLAVEYEHPHLVKYLMEEKHANLTMLNSNQESLLYLAVVNNDFPLLKQLWDEKKLPFDVNYQNRYNDTLLHTAAIMNRSQIARYLVDEKHASLNIPGTDGMTPLHCAACMDIVDICKFLCERGADSRIRDDEDHQPWEKAFSRDLIEYLNTSASRTRRSILPSETMYHEPIRGHDQMKFVGELGSDGMEKSQSLHIQSFFLVARYVLRKCAGLLGFEWADEPHPIFLSPSQILAKQADPYAIDAVYAASEFEELP